MLVEFRSRTFIAALVAAALLAPAAAQADPRVIEIAARRFAFDPPEVHLRRGEPVVLRLTSRDVTHGFYSKPLGIDAEIHPGKVTEVALTPKAAGAFTVICDHFCGSGHGNMKMSIVVEEPVGAR